MQTIIPHTVKITIITSKQENTLYLTQVSPTFAIGSTMSPGVLENNILPNYLTQGILNVTKISSHKHSNNKNLIVFPSTIKKEDPPNNQQHYLSNLLISSFIKWHERNLHKNPNQYDAVLLQITLFHITDI